MITVYWVFSNIDLTNNLNTIISQSYAKKVKSHSWFSHYCYKEHSDWLCLFPPSSWSGVTRCFNRSNTCHWRPTLMWPWWTFHWVSKPHSAGSRSSITCSVTRHPSSTGPGVNRAAWEAIKASTHPGGMAGPDWNAFIFSLAVLITADYNLWIHASTCRSPPVSVCRSPGRDRQPSPSYFFDARAFMIYKGRQQEAFSVFLLAVWFVPLHMSSQLVQHFLLPRTHKLSKFEMFSFKERFHCYILVCFFS